MLTDTEINLIANADYWDSWWGYEHGETTKKSPEMLLAEYRGAVFTMDSKGHYHPNYKSLHVSRAATSDLASFMGISSDKYLSAYGSRKGQKIIKSAFVALMATNNEVARDEARARLIARLVEIQ